MDLKIIARIRNDFPTKFGIPRQSGLAETDGLIVFEPEFRNPDSLRGLEGFSHVWLIWGFSEAEREDWSPTVRPPRLGGNEKKGVFATRSPYRPNPIGLSSVKLLAIEHSAKFGTVLRVSGADLMDGTPIYDVKPYLPFTDCHSDAVDGFAGEVKDYSLSVEFPSELKRLVAKDKLNPLIEILSEDPRPAYQNDEERVYGFYYAEYEIKFKVKNATLYVTDVREK